MFCVPTNLTSSSGYISKTWVGGKHRALLKESTEDTWGAEAAFKAILAIR